MNNSEYVGLFFIVLIPLLGGLISLFKTITTPIKQLEIAIERLIIILDQVKTANDNLEKRVSKHGEEIDETFKLVDKICFRLDALEKRCENR